MFLFFNSKLVSIYFFLQSILKYNRFYIIRIVHIYKTKNPAQCVDYGLVGWKRRRAKKINKGKDWKKMTAMAQWGKRLE